MTGAPAPIRSVAILGGGTAGWMTAAALRRALGGAVAVTLVESEEIGTVGVGEATIPPIRSFNALVGLDEAAFVAATGATFKLGIVFDGWGAAGERYMHPFGEIGHGLEGVEFHHLWLKHRGAAGVGGLLDYSVATMAARAGRFDRPAADPRSPLSTLAYAYHFDAGLYARHLRAHAEALGATRIEGRVVDVERGENGDVAAIRLADGRRVAGELFVDCSGFRSVLLGGTLDVGFESWAEWLPCDRALAVPDAAVAEPPPYTVATAHAAGWRWRIPLQHRTGNGIVYSSAFTGDAEAEQTLLAGLGGAPAAEIRPIAFTAGRRRRLWERNVVAIGLSGGFLEPLESTSIHLIQSGISKLLALFPDSGFAPIERAEYNRLMTAQYDAIRDFVILHYKANRRPEPFWRRCRDMDVPDSLATRMALFAEKGRIFRYDDDLFSIASWVSVLIGQGIIPHGHDPLATALDDARVLEMMARMRAAIARASGSMPSHRDFIAGMAKASGAR